MKLKKNYNKTINKRIIQAQNNRTICSYRIKRKFVHMIQQQIKENKNMDYFNLATYKNSLKKDFVNSFTSLLTNIIIRRVIKNTEISDHSWYNGGWLQNLQFSLVVELLIVVVVVVKNNADPICRLCEKYVETIKFLLPCSSTLKITNTKMDKRLYNIHYIQRNISVLHWPIICRKMLWLSPWNSHRNLWEYYFLGHYHSY